MGKHLAKLTPSQYRSNKLRLIPRTKAAKDKYLKIYHDYITNYLTEEELAEKYGYRDHNHIHHVIKWACYYTNTSTNIMDYKRSIDRIERQLRELNERLPAAETPKDEVMLRGEMRRLIRLQAQIQGILNAGVNINIHSGAKTEIPVLTSVNHRGKVVDIETVKDGSGNGSGDISDAVEAGQRARDEAYERGKIRSEVVDAEIVEHNNELAQRHIVEEHAQAQVAET